MTTLEELVELEPDPTHGHPIQIEAVSGVWRWVVELADTTAGTYVEWLDITDYYVGDRHQFGADQPYGDARARLVTVQLQIDDSDLLAPWGFDTTEILGEDVELDAGLLMRAALARVDGGVTVEWLPVWTGRVESWGDASFASGQTRVHEVSVVDTISDLANVPTIVDVETYWDDWFTEQLLPAANWLFGVDIYGDETDAGLPQDLNMVNAINRMDQGTDPLGLVWRSRRNGRLVIHPAPWDTTNTERYANPLLDVYPDGIVFSYSPETGEVEYIDGDNQQPFGVRRSVAGVLNSFTVTRPDTTVYATDDPTSISKFGTRPFQASWILDNDPVVDDLLTARAFASVEALPLRTSIDHEGFFPALAMIDHLDPVTVEHTVAEGRPVVTVVGTVRNVVEERTFAGTADAVSTLNWQSTVQIDVTSTTTAEALLPVEDLALVSAFTPGFGGPSGAEFSWTNPTQPSVTPTDVEMRILERSLVWVSKDYPGVGADGNTFGFLAAATAYTLQVRLVRRVNGVATAVSPIREIQFTTPASILPTPVPDGTDTDVEVGEPPDFDPDDCELEVELQENDGDPDTWTTVDTFTGSELTDNGDGTWSLTTPIDNSFFNEGSMYRFRAREVCDGTPGDWFNGPEFDPPDDWTDPCTTPPALADAPFDDAIVYVPQICAPDIIREAVSGIEGVHGDALDAILALVDDPNQRALKAIADPEWSDTPGGIVAYGECPQTTGVTGDKSIVCKVNVADDTVSCVLFECAAMRLTATAVSGGGWRPGVTVYKVGSTVSLAGASVLDEDTTYNLAATHDFETGDIKLYVDAVEDNTVGGTDNVATINALPIWRVGVPPSSWITDCAVWDRVLDQSELPGYVPVVWALAVDWEHAWWTEGPVFLAAHPTLTNNDQIDTWQDEVGTAHFTSSGGARPLWQSAPATVGKPAMAFDGSNDKFGPLALTTINAPHTIVVIGAFFVTTTSKYMIDGFGASNRRIIRIEAGPVWSHFAGANATGGTANTTLNGFRSKIVSGTSDSLHVDGSLITSGSAGDQAITGLTLGSDYTGAGAFFDGYIAFVGVFAGDVTSDPGWSAFVSGANAHYGTTLF